MWYEVFDDEQVQLQTRQHVRRVVIGLIVVLCSLALAGPLVVATLTDAGLALVALAVFAVATVAVVTVRLIRLQRVMWCVKLSVHRIVGFDYARRKTVLAWDEVERVEVDDHGLLVVGKPGPQSTGPVLRIPSRYTEFPTLSHRAAEYAEAHGVPICIDGRPWQFLDVSEVYPFLYKPVAKERQGRSFFGSRD